jgi:sugar O-acyltransferase (sialic acid O-acetyltransferase NeuD family)
MKPKLVIWGAGSYGMVITDIICLRDEFTIAGFLDDANPERHGTDFHGFPILGGKECLDTLRESGIENVIIGFGDCDARREAAALALAKGYSLPTAIHPRAYIASSASVKPGVVIRAMTVVDAGATIQENVLIGAGVYVSHECTVESCVCLASGVRIGGLSTVGRGSWLGIGAVVADRVRIGRRAKVGAGAVVLRDVPDNAVVAGTPAKVRWSRDVFDGEG